MNVIPIFRTGTMKVSYFHVAKDVPNINLPEAAVVTDVLRATTTISWALYNGADSIEVFADLDALRKSSLSFPKEERLLVGERGGKRIEGFDLGNSPQAVTKKVVLGKRLFMSTTNGTRSLECVREVEILFALSLPNRSAIAKRLLKERPSDIWIVGSGWEGSYSLEDSLAAGALASYLIASESSNIIVQNDELYSALALWEIWKKDRETLLRKATHGQRLINLGNHDVDFKICSELDHLEVVPTQTQRGVLRAT